MPTIDDLKRIADVEFGDIVNSTHQISYKLRIILINTSFVDVHLSQIPEITRQIWVSLGVHGRKRHYLSLR